MTNYPAANFCELKPDPEAMATDGCIHTNLDEHEGICQPPMELSGLSAVPGSPTEGEPSSNSPDLEDPALVSKSPGNVHSLPTNHSGKCNLIQASHTLAMPHVTPQLAVWIISGDDTKSSSFWRKLQNSCSHHGERSHPGPMIRNSRNGLPGVV